MKKVLIGMLALLLVFGFSACSGGDNLKKMSLDEIVEKAKTDGDSWTEDQWKDALRGAITSVSPMLQEAQEMQKEAEENPEKALEILGKLSEKQEEWSALGQKFEEFLGIAEKSEVGQKVANDMDFQKEICDELGLDPSLMN